MGRLIYGTLEFLACLGVAALFWYAVMEAAL